METTETITAASPLELTKAPRKAPALDLRDIPQAPGPEKACWPSWPWTPPPTWASA